MNTTDLVGMKFGRLVVVSFAVIKNGTTYWNCACECGNTKIIGRNCLISTTTQSCGCLQKETKKQWRKTFKFGKGLTHKGSQSTPSIFVLGK